MSRSSRDAQGCSSYKRLFPVTISASGVREEQLLRNIKQRLLDSGSFDCLPPSARTSHLRCLAFRLLSQSGCAAVELKFQRMSHPSRIYLSIHNHAILEETFDTAECVLDPHTIAFIASYPEAVSNPEVLDDAVHDLYHSAGLMEEETVPQERWHSFLRRSFVGNSVQTWAQSGADLNAE